MIDFPRKKIIRSHIHYHMVNIKEKKYSGKSLMKFLIYPILTDNLPKGIIIGSCECEYHEYNHNTKYYMNTLKLVKLYGMNNWNKYFYCFITKFLLNLINWIKGKFKKRRKQTDATRNGYKYLCFSVHNA